jgi:GAF domain-containing protein
MIGNRAIGVIMTQKYEEGSAYTESQLDYFVAIADTVALAIQEKKDELNRAQNARMLEEMNYIANAVGASMSLKNLCQEIHAIIKRLIPRDELSRNFYLAVLPV